MQQETHGGFNYSYYLYSNDIYGVIKVDSVSILDNDSFNLIYFIQNKVRSLSLELFHDNKDTARYFKWNANR